MVPLKNSFMLNFYLINNCYLGVVNNKFGNTVPNSAGISYNVVTNLLKNTSAKVKKVVSYNLILDLTLLNFFTQLKLIQSSITLLILM